jgi:hypothetical protein
MLLATPSDSTTFYVALSLMAGITRDDAVSALRMRLAALDGAIARATAQVATLLETLPRLVLVEAEYLRAHFVAERAWVEQIIAEAESGELSWDLRFGPGANDPA